jgi:hypothetical protein
MIHKAKVLPGRSPCFCSECNAHGSQLSRRFTSQIIKLLIEADLVIADLTNNNANVYYELTL